MKSKMMLLTLGAALMAAPAFAAPGDKRPSADADGNGVITRAEADAAATQRFQRLDVNGDGKLDATDREARRAEMQKKRFERLDANKDGQVSQAEWDQHAAARDAKRAGSDKAGAGERKGKRGHFGKRGGHRMAAAMMMKADTNGDKAISLAEFRAAAMARFDQMDANKDGQVTAEEREAARSAMRGKHRAGRMAPSN
ncbi:EF-hand domain-containing protein [Sphingopyxis sp. MWB1]|uniref:EF-hand domain-containing protein n=1 Tax=Sphingopyxis sp. MWB1 TaxID=1537715 RepID=UPI00068ECD89|nr:hypothetical protein [Sphingopyxis sp. MWB1]